ncbi:hypothetical protein F7734_18465 [Scytonema sp. UIC 10036]|uniref:hypothetical protein n=1 Tax=Scytonema sp. UIC 10036 TaxID=2304196 RepID=UPI0012DAA5C2|nr:hypothetical protein [Scytonema sp. UIC 10036]MUG94257.1 hypothetical protein [Scytonema sp. UIC 10036]
MSYLKTRRTTASDFNFIYDLHRQVFYSYIEQTWGWKEEFQFNEMREDGSSVLSGLISSKTFLTALCSQLFKHYLS